MYSNCAITSFKHLWFIFKNISDKMEMEINVTNNKNFTKVYLKIKLRGRETSWYIIF